MKQIYLFLCLFFFFFSCTRQEAPPEQPFPTERRLYRDPEGELKIKTEVPPPKEPLSKVCSKIYDRILRIEDNLEDAYNDLEDEEEDLAELQNAPPTSTSQPPPVSPSLSHTQRCSPVTLADLEFDKNEALYKLNDFYNELYNDAGFKIIPQLNNALRNSDATAGQKDQIKNLATECIVDTSASGTNIQHSKNLVKFAELFDEHSETGELDTFISDCKGDLSGLTFLSDLLNTETDTTIHDELDEDFGLYMDDLPALKGYSDDYDSDNKKFELRKRSCRGISTDPYTYNYDTNPDPLQEARDQVQHTKDRIKEIERDLKDEERKYNREDC